MLNLSAPLQMRPCKDADHEFLLALYRTTRGDLLQMQAEPDFIAHLIAMQFQIQTQGCQNMYPNAEYWLILRDAHAIGRLILDQQDGGLRIVDIAFAPQERGCGHGTSLLRSLQAWAADQRRALHLSVSHSNPRAQKLYLAMGFVPRGSDALQAHLCWQASVKPESA